MSDVDDIVFPIDEEVGRKGSQERNRVRSHARCRLLDFFKPYVCEMKSKILFHCTMFVLSFVTVLALFSASNSSLGSLQQAVTLPAPLSVVNSSTTSEGRLEGYIPSLSNLCSELPRFVALDAPVLYGRDLF